MAATRPGGLAGQKLFLLQPSFIESANFIVNFQFSWIVRFVSAAPFAFQRV